MCVSHWRKLQALRQLPGDQEQPLGSKVTASTASTEPSDNASPNEVLLNASFRSLEAGYSV